MNNDAVSIAPHLHKVIHENDKVRILEVTVKPGDSAEMHTHPDNVITVLQGGSLEMASSDGTVKTIELITGTSFFSPASEHSVKNNSDSEVKVIQVELK
ncbi:cupin domain-containing protein [bacterium]|nr:MAG: cupin domain-containing protein [bacterium]